MKLRFRDKKCPSCEKEFDPTLEACPHCQNPNEELSHRLYPISTPVGVFREVFLFLMGFLGFQIIGILVGMFALRFGDEESLIFKTITNYGSYALLSVSLSLIVWKKWPLVLSVFKNHRTYLGFAVGIILVAFNLIYGLILSRNGIGSNANQDQLVLVVNNSPVLGFILLGILGPICEELTYRLGLFNVLKRVHISLAYILVPIIFALIHFNFTDPSLVEWLNLPNYIVCGLILTFTHDRLSVGASSIAHVINNIVALSLILVQHA